MVWGFVTCGPNHALVVSGFFHAKPLLVAGGRTFVWPMIQQVQEISLKTMTLHIESAKVYTALGVPINVIGVAQVKIQGQNKEMLLTACEQFLGRSKIEEIEKVALETLEGHQRAIMGSMTVEEIYKDRKKFSKNVYEVASVDLMNMGITIISYTLTDVSDDHGYLKSLGMGRTAEVKRDARIGEAEAQRDSRIKKAIALEEEMAAKYLNDTEIAKAKRDYELKKSTYDSEVNTKKAEAEIAYALQVAKTQQRIREEQMQIKVVEREQDIAVQEQEIQRMQRQLDATVRRPAEAEKYRLEKLAEANRNRVILEAEAQAEAIRIKGEAEAIAMEAKGSADADRLTRKAEAYKLYKDAAVVELLLEALPKIAASVAAPLTNTNKMTLVSTGGEIGAAKLSYEILETVLRMPQLISTVTGVDITKTVTNKSSNSNWA
ncbi:unnamed protein product [Allacma fusca]|uniref:Band 7 domain-containing protein n=1 Tax=Allacma fusca TaxID=39272 RepID=A0A8J2JYH1_9HEXA|nr:unnamed protein product [Allacma fusca]